MSCIRVILVFMRMARVLRLTFFAYIKQNFKITILANNLLQPTARGSRV